jgi:3-hydroxyisobutyrate dehydrogenase
MGRPIASCLLAGGFDVIVWNRSPEKCDELLEQGAEPADSIADLTADSDIIMLCLSDTAAVREVVFGEDGVAANGDGEQLLVDLSSIDPDATRRFARDLDLQCAMGWVDAPVSGGVLGAENGTLVVMAGGSEEDVERVRPLLDAFSQRVTRMGGVGAGQVTKVCNQMIVGCVAVAMTEMIALAERAGVDAELLSEAMRGGFADSIPLQIYAPRIAVRMYEPVLGKLGTLTKDLDAAVQLARASAAAVPLTGLAAQLLHQHAVRTPCDADWSTLIEMYSE